VIDEALVQIFGQALFGRLGSSARSRLLARLLFGTLGASLGIVGAFVIAERTASSPNLALRASIVGLFGFLSAFCLFNVALARTWRWPGALFVASLVATFVARIAFGP
jgi:hypothetical protein